MHHFLLLKLDNLLNRYNKQFSNKGIIDQWNKKSNPASNYVFFVF